MERRSASPTGDPPKALVLGRDARSFLAVIRSLGRRGVEVHVGWCERDALALRSRHVSRYHDLPVAKTLDGPWLEPLEELCERERFDLVLPTHDASVVALFHQRHRLAEKARVYQLGERAFEVCYDKRATSELARELGIPVPDEVLIGGPGEEATRAEELLARLGTPLVLKPRRSFAFGRKKWEHQVRKVPGPAELEVSLLALLEQGEVLAQENVPGRGLGVEVLADGGELLLAFQHERLHEPLNGGGSSYRRSVPLDPELLSAVRSFARAVDYTGVGMFEFKRDARTGRWWLIEVNARFWGSLPLAAAAGVDFPWALFRLLVRGEREFESDYRAGVHCRNLSMDATWIWRNLRADRDDPLLATVAPTRLLAELGNVPLGREHLDSFSLDDPRPGFAELGRLTSVVAGAAGRKLARWPYRSALLRRRLTAKLRRAAPRARRILFVCKGNICRSPFAERVARRLLPAVVEVSSRGTFREGDRPCPAEARRAARAHGVELSDFRSRVLDEEAVATAELILVFDAADLARVSSAFPAARGKLFRLGPLADRGPVDVRDPYGGGLEAFEEAYRAIAAALEPLAALCRAAAPGSESGPEPEPAPEAAS